MHTNIVDEQKEVCEKYGVEYVPTPSGWKIGISKNIASGLMPINGLRHKPENGTMGWYIWAGEYSEDPNFFESVHVEHMGEKCPLVLKYLGLAPGWRFQIDNKGYQDVWEDKSLLKL